MVANRDTIQPGLYSRRIPINSLLPIQMSTLQTLNYSVLRSFPTRKSIQSLERVTSDQTVSLFQTKAEDKYALADEMNRHYDYNLSINAGGPLNILECNPKM